MANSRYRRPLLSGLLGASLGLVFLCPAAWVQAQTPETGPKLEVSSELKSKKTPGRYAARHLHDGDPKTAWVEGKQGAGQGEWIRATFSEPTPVTGFLLIPGYARSRKVFVENAAPARVSLWVDGTRVGRYVIPFRQQMRDEEAPTTVGGQEAMACYPTGDGHADLRILLFEEPPVGKQFELRVDAAVAGQKYQDLAVSEWRLLRAGHPDPLLGAAEKKIASSLRTLRNGEALPELLSRVGSSIDLRKAPQVKQEASGQEKAESRAAERMAGKDADPLTQENAKAAAAVYLSMHSFAFFDRILTLEKEGSGWHLLGGLAARAGDGEWIELYPELRFDAEGALKSVSEAAYQDGAPGCHDAYPDRSGGGARSGP